MKSNKNSQSGVLLIEVLFSILIFSFGILGLVGLQAVATQNSVGAEDRNTASLLVSDLVAQMYIFKTSNVTPGANPLPGANPAGLAIAIAAWQARVANPANKLLPNAVGNVTVSLGITTITIDWQSPGKPTPNHYETQIVI